MFRLYSKGCEYAIRALVCAVREGGQGRFQAGDVCRKVDIPEYFTRKIFQALVQGGFLHAVRGPGGGYALTRPPEEISVLDVVRAVDGEDTFDHCVMGLDECSDEHGCPMHPVWSRAKGEMLQQLRRTTLRDIVQLSGDRDFAVEFESQPIPVKPARSPKKKS